MVKTIEGSGQAPARPSIDPSEVAKFTAMAEEWWDPRGKFKPLHRFNPVRLAFIRKTIEAHFGLAGPTAHPLTGIRLLDIGCGGGLISEPMARLGAEVTGVDAGEANIKTAMTHAAMCGLEIDYRMGTAEGLIDAGTPAFDVVLNMEVVEHVADARQFLHDTASLVRPGGLMISATINRTSKARMMAIFAAERILRWLPAGTHDYEKLVTPAEMQAALRAAGLDTQAAQGVTFNLVSQGWRLSADTDMNYMMVATRPAQAKGNGDA